MSVVEHEDEVPLALAQLREGDDQSVHDVTAIGFEFEYVRLG